MKTKITTFGRAPIGGRVRRLILAALAASLAIATSAVAPSAGLTGSAFTDVDPNAYYAQAVAWAEEVGVTTGTSGTTFSPDATMTRDQAVTMMWRAAGSPGERADIVREFNVDGTAAPGTEVIGSSTLIRSASGLKATVAAEGLVPDGVYTFWLVVPHSLPPTIPDDVFVVRGGSVVVGADGKATVVMEADTGQAGILGFPPLDGALFHDLTDPLNSLVRVEIAYHGQVGDAGADLGTWQSDFWTGSACPPTTPNPNAAQPHCPVYFASTHAATGFTDVPADAYYQAAVNWAKANGITTGTTATTFSPNSPLTRAQGATVLWRQEGRP
jgi:hypothetical protein